MSNVLSNIDRAKELLSTTRHACMATVNEDGTPHNTPFMFLRDGELEHIYWSSHPESLHSKNVMRNGIAFIVFYDAIEPGGLYVSVNNIHSLDGVELDKALEIYNGIRLVRGQEMLTSNYYRGKDSQRMWSAATVQFWVNDTQRDDKGYIIRDSRIEITRADLV